jgi:hypothetical protein
MSNGNSTEKSAFFLKMIIRLVVEESKSYFQQKRSFFGDDCYQEREKFIRDLKSMIDYVRKSRSLFMYCHENGYTIPINDFKVMLDELTDDKLSEIISFGDNEIMDLVRQAKK